MAIQKKLTAAFSLVELSIVLVILGLLVGGILAGQSLIRAAELRAVSTELNNYTTSLHAFRDKYFVLPGDMGNAISFWGKDAVNCNGSTGTAASPGACNGDANSMVDNLEYYQVWRHLANAGLIEGSYTGAISGGINTLPGVNSPKSKFPNNTYSFFYQNYTPGDAFNTQMNYGHNFNVGGSNTIYGATGTIFKSEEIWNIDVKIDDGKPGQGRLIASYWDQCTNATSFTDYTGAYALNDSSAQCSFRYKLQ